MATYDLYAMTAGGATNSTPVVTAQAITDQSGDTNVLGDVDGDTFTYDSNTYTYQGTATVGSGSGLIQGFYATDSNGRTVFFVESSLDTGDAAGGLQVTETARTSSDTTWWDLTTDGPVCYARGTHILSECGEVAVEDLKIGDRVMTMANGLRTVKWIGRRRYAGPFMRRNEGIMPILVRRGALGEDVPHRDLRLSPGHALFLGGALVKVNALVNGASIVQEEAVGQIEYFHIELESHDILLAEGAAAESYIECGNHGRFHNAEEFARLYPEDDRPSWAYSAPFMEAAAVAALHERLAARARSLGLATRARALGWATTQDPDLHLLIDGRRLDPQRVEGTVYAFAVPEGVGEIRVRSRAARPCDVGFSADRRRLGVDLRRITLRSADVEITVGTGEPALADGFHKVERNGHHWTKGDAGLPPRLHAAFAGPFALELDIGCLRCYPASDVVATGELAA